MSSGGVGNLLCSVDALFSDDVLLCPSSSSAYRRVGVVGRLDFLLLEDPLLAVGEGLVIGEGVDGEGVLAVGGEGVVGVGGLVGRVGVEGPGSRGPPALLFAASRNSSKLAPMCSQMTLGTSHRYDTLWSVIWPQSSSPLMPCPDGTMMPLTPWFAMKATKAWSMTRLGRIPSRPSAPNPPRMSKSSDIEKPIMAPSTTAPREAGHAVAICGSDKQTRP